MAESQKVDYQYLQIEGVHLRAGILRRDTDSLPLLLFNGIGASMELLQPIADELKHTTVISYDAPGTEKSQPPPCPWRPRHHARLAAKMLDRLGFDRVNVLGISWGGLLAQQFARQYSARTERLVLAASSPGHLMVLARLSVLLRVLDCGHLFLLTRAKTLAPEIEAFLSFES